MAVFLADIYAKDKYSDTALHWAAHEGFDQILSLLLFLGGPDQLTLIDHYGQVMPHNVLAI